MTAPVMTMKNGANRGAATSDVTLAAMAVQTSTNTFDLFTASNYSGTLASVSPEMKIVSDYNATGTLTIGFDDNAYPVRDLTTERYFIPEAAQATSGWVKIDGTPVFDIVAEFTFNGESMNDSVYAAFIAYLNSGLSGSGYRLAGNGRTDEDASVSLLYELLTNSTYDMLGWRFTHFNEMHGTNVSLLSLSHVPEPATWLMLLLGAAAILFHPPPPPRFAKRP